MALAAAEHDQVGSPLLGDPHDLGLDVAGRDVAGRGLDAELRGKLGEALPRARDEFLLDLHRRQQRLAHRLDRDVLDDVQQRQLRATGGREGAGPLAHRPAVLAEVHDQQDP